MRAVLLQVFDQKHVLHPLNKVQQVVEDVRIERNGDGRDLGVQRRHSSVLGGVKFALLLVVAVQLGCDSHVRKNELELAPADLSEHLVHHVVELRCFHCFKDLIFHRACRFPKTGWYVHLTHAVPVQAQACDVEVFQQLIRCV